MFIASAFVEVLPATLLLIAFAVIGGVVIMMIRRNLRSKSSTTSTFTLGDLRKFRDEGKISQEEYEKARQLIIDSSM
tara:strand:+ start:43 stop:273 length:231 start_codon:yes stop_codon:yes gene_type:complete